MCTISSKVLRTYFTDCDFVIDFSLIMMTSVKHPSLQVSQQLGLGHFSECSERESGTQTLKGLIL